MRWFFIFRKNINMKNTLWISLIFLVFLSCKKENSEVKTLIFSNDASTKIFNEEINEIKRFFKNKREEQQVLYYEYYDKIIMLEKEMNVYSKLESIESKKEFLQKFKDNLEKNYGVKGVVFNSLKMNVKSDALTFNSVANNDISRTLYSFYKTMYVYSPAKEGL